MQVRHALRRNRLLATGLLALMIVIAAATRIEPSPGWLVQLMRAGAEAGIIGGLADWFAITVLFRHPFGIPIPHTAILPRNKDRIGRSLGSFVERNFLVPEVILPKLRQADLTGKLATWLALPQTAPMIADWIITVLKRLLAAGHSAQINEFIQHTIGQQLRTIDLARRGACRLCYSSAVGCHRLDRRAGPRQCPVAGSSASRCKTLNPSLTLWKQGASTVRVLARLRIIFGSAGIGIGGVLPIGTALVTEFAPRRIRARVNIT
jgi:hypothetical protein